ncbi:MAG: hypothetical protein ACWA47_04310 [Brevirhabdus sp.]
MNRRLQAALCVALVFSTSSHADTFGDAVESNLQRLAVSTSQISDTFFFDPINDARARISDGMVAKAAELDLYLEAEGWIMPDSAQVTGPVQGVAQTIADVSCAFGDLTLGTAQDMRDGVKSMAATGVTSAARMGEAMFTAVASRIW